MVNIYIKSKTACRYIKGIGKKGGSKIVINRNANIGMLFLIDKIFPPDIKV